MKMNLDVFVMVCLEQWAHCSVQTEIRYCAALISSTRISSISPLGGGTMYMAMHFNDNIVFLWCGHKHYFYIWDVKKSSKYEESVQVPCDRHLYSSVSG